MCVPTTRHEDMPAISKRPLRLLLLLACIACGASATHYKTLGVQKTASADDIKAAYRKIALKHHPDRISRSASTQTRKQSTTKFERANEAFEVLSDPSQRRQYDFELANPIQQGADGIHRQGAPGAQRRPRVEVQVLCGLEQLGGWQPVKVSLAAWTNALGATVTDEIAQRLLLPRSIYLPPGSRGGDTVRHVVPSLGPVGCDVDFVLVAKPHKRWRRNGDALLTTIRLPCWHNALGAPAVKLRHLDGDDVLVRARGEKVQRGRGEVGKGGSRGGSTTTTLAGRGMPRLSTPAGGDAEGDAAAEDDEDGARGELRVELALRSVREECALQAARLAAAALCLVTAKGATSAVPALVRFASEQIGYALAVTNDFLTNEVFGRARPQARAARRRAQDERRLQRQRRRAARQAERDRKERERTWQSLRAKTTEPLAKRARNAWRWAFDPEYDDDERDERDQRDVR